MLKAMRRPGTRESNLQLLQRFREKVPGAALRSSFIVGYPGETEAQFDELLSFFEAAQLDRVGVFTYSQESLTPSGSLEGQVDDSVKQQRQQRAMQLGASISAGRLKQRVGSTVQVLVERPARSADAMQGKDGLEHGSSPGQSPAKKAWLRKGSDLWVGRTQYDAPDIDGKVYFTPAQALPKPGDFVSVRIEQSTDHDLVGEMLA